MEFTVPTKMLYHSTVLDMFIRKDPGTPKYKKIHCSRFKHDEFPPRTAHIVPIYEKAGFAFIHVLLKILHYILIS